MIECQEEGCTNLAVWVFRGGLSLCNKHYWQDKCSCRAGFDNPKCAVHGREVSIEQGINPDWAGSVGPDPRDSSIDIVRLQDAQAD